MAMTALGREMERWHLMRNFLLRFYWFRFDCVFFFFEGQCRSHRSYQNLCRSHSTFDSPQIQSIFFSEIYQIVLNFFVLHQTRIWKKKFSLYWDSKIIIAGVVECLFSKCLSVNIGTIDIGSHPPPLSSFNLSSSVWIYRFENRWTCSCWIVSTSTSFLMFVY